MLERAGFLSADVRPSGLFPEIRLAPSNWGPPPPLCVYQLGFPSPAAPHHERLVTSGSTRSLTGLDRGRLSCGRGLGDARRRRRRTRSRGGHSCHGRHDGGPGPHGRNGGSICCCCRAWETAPLRSTGDSSGGRPSGCCSNPNAKSVRSFRGRLVNNALKRHCHAWQRQEAECGGHGAAQPLRNLRRGQRARA